MNAVGVLSCASVFSKICERIYIESHGKISNVESVGFSEVIKMLKIRASIENHKIHRKQWSLLFAAIFIGLLVSGVHYIKHMEIVQQLEASDSSIVAK